MIILDLLTNFHNWLSDKDFIWWPFSFLKPAPQEEMTFKLTAQMTGCFGGLAFLMFTIMAAMNSSLSFEYALSVFFASFGSFFTWFNLVTKPFWNRRSRKLKTGN
jgi:hypothetical protein